MTWNWQQKNWPVFTYDEYVLEPLEAKFLHQSGVLFGMQEHLSDNDKDTFKINIMSNEALKTSEIEGEYLNRDSLQSSIRRNLGLDVDNRKIPAAEQGIAELMVSLYQSVTMPLTHEALYKWHKMLTNGRRDLGAVGYYRTHEEPMQIVSGRIYEPKIHFEAPPSKDVMYEMNQFIKWFNETAPGNKNTLPALTRAGIVHLYFICIHPFEDGNGRIGRALVEKALSQHFGQPILIALSTIIQSNKKVYYEMLEYSNKTLEITSWLDYFAKTILSAQEYTQSLINFLIEKTKLYERIKGQLNSRQEKAIIRMFQEGVQGFKGGLSAENYIRITNTSRATATRDLQDLVEKRVLMQSGELKGTRYHLNIKSNNTQSNF